MPSYSIYCKRSGTLEPESARLTLPLHNLAAENGETPPENAEWSFRLWEAKIKLPRDLFPKFCENRLDPRLVLKFVCEQNDTTAFLETTKDDEQGTWRRFIIIPNRFKFNPVLSKNNILTFRLFLLSGVGKEIPITLQHVELCVRGRVGIEY